jgi:riboflavin kinase / FMN adenylyltransferase
MTRVVAGIDALEPGDGPLFVVVGVFDGLHRGHRYLLDHLVRESASRSATPTVITFDHHPDEILTGTAPALLLDPHERLVRLGEAGVEVTVVQHFDETLRRTPYDAFVARIMSRTSLAGFLMTPDAAFGHERRGTPDALRALGDAHGFEVVVVPSFDLDGRPVRSTDIRAAIASGDLAHARHLLGRDVTISGEVDADPVDGRRAVRFDLPVALPPDGDYEGTLSGHPVGLRIDGGRASVDLRGASASRITMALSTPPGDGG